MARRRFPRNLGRTVDDRIDEVRHGEAIGGPRYYRVRSHQLTVKAYREWLQTGIPLEELEFTEIEFRELTGRRATARDEV
jgi:hypothetical protein